jgi:hypothetical protein
VISATQHRSSGRLLAETETRVDIALLVSALFLQRFSLLLGNKVVAFDYVFPTSIYLYQFLSGKILIQYDRLFWFLATMLVVTCSLLLNFKSTMLSSYFLFLVLFLLATVSRPSTPYRYRSTLQAFQILVMLLSYLAVAQFFAQFVLDGRKLIRFYGLVPDFLLGTLQNGWNTIHTIEGSSSLLKSNGIFLGEPSTLSEVTAIGILIEVLEFHRPRYMLAMTLGFLTAYSGTGMMTLLLFLPLAGLRHGRAGLSALLIVIFALGLFATGIIDLSVFLSRVGEFQDTRASGFARFVSSFWLAAKYFDTAFLQAWLIGNGPGTATTFSDIWYGGGAGTWLKLFYEYGMIGSFVFVCFFASCLRRSRCPKLVLAALLFTYIFHAGFLLAGWLLTIMFVLCTLHERRRSEIDETSRYGQSVVVGSAIG